MELPPKLKECVEETKPKKLKKYSLIDLAVRPDQQKALALWFGEDPDFPFLSIVDLEKKHQRLLKADLAGLPIRMVLWSNNDNEFQLADHLNGITAYKLDKYNAVFVGPVKYTDKKYVWAFDPCSLPRLEWRRYRELGEGKFEKISRTGLSYESNINIRCLEELVKNEKYIIYPLIDIISANEILASSFSSFSKMAERLALPKDDDDDDVWSAYFGKSRSEITEEDIKDQRMRLLNLVSMGEESRAEARKHFEQLINSDVSPPQCADELDVVVKAINDCLKVDNIFM